MYYWKQLGHTYPKRRVFRALFRNAIDFTYMVTCFLGYHKGWHVLSSSFMRIGNLKKIDAHGLHLLVYSPKPTATRGTEEKSDRRENRTDDGYSRRAKDGIKGRATNE
jgi:hypothetical protein